MARSARTRLWPAGLRWRLAAAVAAVTLACTAIAFIAVYSGTATELRRQIDREITGDSNELVAALTASNAHDPASLARVATEYVRGQPFRLSSTLLYVQIPGIPTITNRPELFGSERDDGESYAEQHREDVLSNRLLGVPEGYSTLTGVDVGQLRIVRVPVPIHGIPQPVAVGVGETLNTVSQAQKSVARAFILAGLLALAGALLASYLIGTRVSRPLRRMAAVAARVDAGDLHPRIHDPERLRGEVRVLADSFNHMLDRLTDAFAGQRAFVADASHELRTPLTVIRGQLELLAADPNPTASEVRRVERLAAGEIARISRLVDDLLLLAKSEQTEFLQVDAIDLPRFVEELWDGVSLVADRRFEIDRPPSGTLRADPDRLAQALRNLIGNAVEHTVPETGLVRLSVRHAGDRVTFVVQDDGPGIAPEQREAVFRRFHRTDAGRDRRSGGAGLGLAIVQAIAEAHGGTVIAGESPEGGASVELTLPGFRSTASRPAPAAAPAPHEREQTPRRTGAIAG